MRGTKHEVITPIETLARILKRGACEPHTDEAPPTFLVVLAHVVQRRFVGRLLHDGNGRQVEVLARGTAPVFFGQESAMDHLLLLLAPRGGRRHKGFLGMDLCMNF